MHSPLSPDPSHHAPSDFPKGRGAEGLGRDYRWVWLSHAHCDSDTRCSLRAEDPAFTSQRLNPLLSTRPQHTHSVLNDIRESILLIGSFSSHFRTSVSALQRFPLALCPRCALASAVFWLPHCANQQNSLTLEGEQQCHSPLSHIQTCLLAVNQITYFIFHCLTCTKLLKH